MLLLFMNQTRVLQGVKGEYGYHMGTIDANWTVLGKLGRHNYPSNQGLE